MSRRGVVRTWWAGRVAVAAGVLVACAASSVQGGAREFLDAQKIKTRIRIQWDGGAKKMMWAADDGSNYVPFAADDLFLTKGTLHITYPRLNPLRVQASASVASLDDPSHATIAKLIEALTSVATIVKPAPLAADDAGRSASENLCPGGDASKDIADLNRQLFGEGLSPISVRSEVNDWAGAVDTAFDAGKSGVSAVRDAVTAIRASDGLSAKLEKIIRDASAVADRVEDGATSAAKACDRTLYGLARLANPRARIQELKTLKKVIDDLAKTLDEQYVKTPTRWQGSDYVVGDAVKPSLEKMASVEVKIVSLSFDVNDVSSSLTVAQQQAGSAKFLVRRYSLVAPEVGIGAVFGSVDRPKYGTTKNAAGATVVGRVPDESVSVDPSLMVNFVCRCNLGFIAPMLQIGAATSKTNPAALLGGGFRLFGLGKGDVAIGGGFMFAWVKDLKTLHEGDAVSGTKDIEADLAFVGKPRRSGYFAIQYKF